MNGAFRACAIGATAALVALSACDSSYSTEPGATNGEGGATKSDSGAAATGDGSISTTDDGAIPSLDGAGTNMTTDGGSVGAPLGNLDCNALKTKAGVLFCADFEGPFPYGFSMSTNNATITQTKDVPNGQSSYVLDMRLAAGADAGTILTELFQPIDRPANGSMQLDADVRIVAFGLPYASIVELSNEPGTSPGAAGVGISAPMGQAPTFVLSQSKDTTFATPGTTWHHVVVTLDAIGNWSVAVDTTAIKTSGLNSANALDLTVGLFDVSAGTASGQTEVQIDNVLVRAL